MKEFFTIKRSLLNVTGFVLAALSLSTSPSPTYTESLLNAKARQILKTHCDRCHKEGGVAQDVFGSVLDFDSLARKQIIAPGNPANSPLFESVRNGEMPKDAKRLSKADIKTLNAWITNFGKAEEPSKKGPASSEADVIEAIKEDFKKLQPSDRTFARYFSFQNQLVAGASAKELNTYRLALAKTINSLSWAPELVVPTAVGSATKGALYRIDLRALKWTPTTWNNILNASPFPALSKLKPEIAEIQTKAFVEATGQPVLWVHGDWFIANAIRPPLYHSILLLPGTIGELESGLGINSTAGPSSRESFPNVSFQTVARAGFRDSGVSQNNRVIERIGFKYGAYWKSHDFASSEGPQNIFANPISFSPAGGEVIFDLPNGMLAFYVTDGVGRRIDRAPVQVVNDTKRPDQAVENGISCMRCHSDGYINKGDQVREVVDKNQKLFDPATIDSVHELYVPRAELSELVKSDSERHRNALARIGITQSQNPVTAAVELFEADVDLRTAAADLDVSAS
jgi:mono/diheme cytochrome c family protein